MGEEFLQFVLCCARPRGGEHFRAGFVPCDESSDRGLDPLGCVDLRQMGAGNESAGGEGGGDGVP